MPPKRKSSTSSAPGPPPSRTCTTRSRAPTTKTFPLSTYIPKLASSDLGGYNFHQKLKCPKDASEHCSSCIGKQAILGGCRFVGIRTFMEMEENGEKTVKWGDYAFRGNQDDEEPTKVVKKAKDKEKEKDQLNGKKPETLHISPERRSTRALRPNLKVENGKNSKGTRTEPDPCIPLPPHVPPTKEDASYILSLVAGTFADHLERELSHETTHLSSVAEARPFIRIKNTPLTRSLCDFCSTSIFMGSYMCGCCGREFCLGCWETWAPSEDLHAGRLLKRNQCSMKRRHNKNNMLFVTRAKPGEISALLEDVKAKIRTIPTPDTSNDEPLVAAIPTETAPPVPNTEMKYLPVPKNSINSFSSSVFRSLWRIGGIPLVLTDLLPRFQLPWSPSYFIKHYGKTTCTLHDTANCIRNTSTVANFFSLFTSTKFTSNSWKLKDWPPSADFSTTFPDLFADFENAIPFPEYTRRNGARNLASQAYFEKIWNPPDLGPKMYNALPAMDFLIDNGGDTEGDMKDEVSGTTNLHLDLTDAVNVLLYTTENDPCPYNTEEKLGIPACGAVWDIFPPSTSSTIRSYLRSKFSLSKIDDPIHEQLFYLSEHDLHVLSQSPYSVHSYRIYQNPGDAVWIPAGCAHQVRNRKASVKVAVDFLSPESIQRGVAVGLLEEARGMWTETRKSRGKEDVVQLWGCLGFVWKALREIESEGDGGVKVEDCGKSG
ncbi:hypothetical protein EX30DRAFT_394108 [Ascodesmis nigricans]|uniref:JmjC domain-containing protein n=1 Tax=Ascodesmis nigricans TaxID=341454 RepID=A0A4S2N145_9PEZI|nr:hypothetical protein EX30DRAFT_394108 [Ascodesmis nigricans]